MISKTLKSGNFLLSEPFMRDPNFKRSVIYITEHTEIGSVGFVLNQKSNLLLGDLFEDVESDFPVFIGGPVENNTLHFIHLLGDIEGAMEIADGVFWGGNFETIKVLLQSNQLNTESIKFFMGYSGWSEGQLEGELDEKAWLMVKSNPEFIFKIEEKSLWGAIVKTLGANYAMMLNFPEDPQLN